MSNLDRLKKIVNNAWKIPSYSSFYQKNKTPKRIKSLSDLEKFPILNQEKYFSLTKKKPVKVSNNSYIIKAMVNSQGDEAVFPLSGQDYQNYILLEKRKFHLIGVKKTDLCSVVLFSQNHTIPLSESFLALGASYISLDGDEEKIFRDIIRYKVTVIFAISPVVERLMNYVEIRNLKTSLRLVITTGVKISDVEKFNQKTKKILGAEIVDTIGASELASFAFSCKEHRNFYHFVDQLQIAEIIDPESGEKADEGEVVVTPLWKIDYPLIRYGTSDFTKLNKELTCKCKVRNKKFFSGVEKRLNKETRIERYLLNLEEFYLGIRDSLLWQNFFDKWLWMFLEKPQLIILIEKINHKDIVFVFIEREKFLKTLRRRKLIEDTIFKMTNADVKIILVDKKILKGLSFKYKDIRDIPKNKLSKKIKDLLKLC